MDAQVAGDSPLETLRERIGCYETNAIHIGSKTVRIFGNRGDRLIAILFIDLDGVGGGNAMPLEKQHDFFNRFLGLPRGLDRFDSLLGNAGDFDQAIDLLLDDVQGFELKVGHDTASGHGSHAFDQSTAQVFLNPGEGGGFGFAVLTDLILGAIFGMLSPGAFHLESLARLEIGKVADDRHQVAHARRFQSRDRVARFFGVVRNPFYDSLEWL
jgi:hypothetical protein